MIAELTASTTERFFHQQQLTQTDTYQLSNNWSLKSSSGASLQKLSNTYSLITKIQWGTDPEIE
jgi:hypothetical protein